MGDRGSTNSHKIEGNKSTNSSSYMNLDDDKNESLLHGKLSKKVSKAINNSLNGDDDQTFSTIDHLDVQVDESAFD
jgi:hypothetical protein